MNNDPLGYGAAQWFFTHSVAFDPWMDFVVGPSILLILYLKKHKFH